MTSLSSDQCSGTKNNLNNDENNSAETINNGNAVMAENVNSDEKSTVADAVSDDEIITAMEIDDSNENSTVIEVIKDDDNSAAMEVVHNEEQTMNSNESTITQKTVNSDDESKVPNETLCSNESDAAEESTNNDENEAVIKLVSSSTNVATESIGDDETKGASDDMMFESIVEDNVVAHSSANCGKESKVEDVLPFQSLFIKLEENDVEPSNDDNATFQETFEDDTSLNHYKDAEEKTSDKFIVGDDSVTQSKILPVKDEPYSPLELLSVTDIKVEPTTDIEDFLFAPAPTFSHDVEASSSEKGIPLRKFPGIVRSIENAEYEVLQALYQVLYLRSAWDTEKVLIQGILDFSGFNCTPDSEDFYTRKLNLCMLEDSVLYKISLLLEVQSQWVYNANVTNSKHYVHSEQAKLEAVQNILTFLYKPVKETRNRRAKAGTSLLRARGKKRPWSRVSANASPNSSTSYDFCSSADDSDDNNSHKLCGLSDSEILEIEKQLKEQIAKGNAAEVKVILEKLDQESIAKKLKSLSQASLPKPSSKPQPSSVLASSSVKSPQLRDFSVKVNTDDMKTKLLNSDGFKLKKNLSSVSMSFKEYVKLLCQADGSDMPQNTMVDRLVPILKAPREDLITGAENEDTFEVRTVTNSKSPTIKVHKAKPIIVVGKVMPKLHVSKKELMDDNEVRKLELEIAREERAKNRSNLQSPGLHAHDPASSAADNAHSQERSMLTIQNDCALKTAGLGLVTPSDATQIIKLNDNKHVKFMILALEYEDLDILHNLIYLQDAGKRRIRRNILKFTGFDFDESSEKYKFRELILERLGQDIVKRIAFIFGLMPSNADLSMKDLIDLIMHFLMHPTKMKQIPMSEYPRRFFEEHPCIFRKDKVFEGIPCDALMDKPQSVLQQDVMMIKDVNIANKHSIVHAENANTEQEMEDQTMDDLFLDKSDEDVSITEACTSNPINIPPKQKTLRFYMIKKKSAITQQLQMKEKEQQAGKLKAVTVPSSTMPRNYSKQRVNTPMPSSSGIGQLKLPTASPLNSLSPILDTTTITTTIANIPLKSTVLQTMLTHTSTISSVTSSPSERAATVSSTPAVQTVAAKPTQITPPKSAPRARKSFSSAGRKPAFNVSSANSNNGSENLNQIKTRPQTMKSVFPLPVEVILSGEDESNEEEVGHPSPEFCANDPASSAADNGDSQVKSLPTMIQNTCALKTAGLDPIIISSTPRMTELTDINHDIVEVRTVANSKSSTIEMQKEKPVIVIGKMVPKLQVSKSADPNSEVKFKRMQKKPIVQTIKGPRYRKELMDDNEVKKLKLEIAREERAKYRSNLQSDISYDAFMEKLQPVLRHNIMMIKDVNITNKHPTVHAANANTEQEMEDQSMNELFLDSSGMNIAISEVSTSSLINIPPKKTKILGAYIIKKSAIAQQSQMKEKEQAGTVKAAAVPSSAMPKNVSEQCANTPNKVSRESTVSQAKIIGPLAVAQSKVGGQLTMVKKIGSQPLMVPFKLTENTAVMQTKDSGQSVTVEDKINQPTVAQNKTSGQSAVPQDKIGEQSAAMPMKISGQPDVTSPMKVIGQPTVAPQQMSQIFIPVSNKNLQSSQAFRPPIVTMSSSSGPVANAPVFILQPTASNTLNGPVPAGSIGQSMQFPNLIMGNNMEGLQSGAGNQIIIFKATPKPLFVPVVQPNKAIPANIQGVPMPSSSGIGQLKLLASPVNSLPPVLDMTTIRTTIANTTPKPTVPQTMLSSIPIIHSVTSLPSMRTAMVNSTPTVQTIVVKSAQTTSSKSAPRAMKSFSLVGTRPASNASSANGNNGSGNLIRIKTHPHAMKNVVPLPVEAILSDGDKSNKEKIRHPSEAEIFSAISDIIQSSAMEQINLIAVTQKLCDMLPTLNLRYTLPFIKTSINNAIDDILQKYAKKKEALRSQI